MVVDLDDARAQDPGIVGAKAARLAQARRAGLPSLPGVVVPLDVARSAIRAASEALARGGSGAARLAIMDTDVDSGVIAALEEDTARLGYPLVARSSSPLEDSGVWAGAFSSFEDVGRADLRTAVRGVWTSAFTVHALERCEAAGGHPADVELAVLLQPQVEPVCAGSARVLAEGGVDVHAVRGSARDLMEGWEVGVRAHVAADGTVHADQEALELGEAALAAAAGLANDVRGALGDNLIEWAWTGAEIVLLQSSQVREHSPAAPATPPHLRDPMALRVARLVQSYPGPLGEELVLPWALGVSHVPAATAVCTRAPADLPVDDPLSCLTDAAALAADLTKEAWQERPDHARRRAVAALRNLRGPEPDAALTALAGVRPVDPDRGARVLALLGRAAADLVRHGKLPDEDRIWWHAPAVLESFSERECLPAPSTPTAGRIGPTPWEPFIHATVRAHGHALHGVAVVPGIAAGRVIVVRNPHDPPRIRDRDVVVVDRPLPALASLLWSASALVAGSGNPAAHLMEVAAALGVPTVLGVDFSPFGGLAGLAAGDRLAAVDGATGAVALVDA